MIPLTQKSLNDLTYQVIGAAIEVHKILGPGLLESVYEKCLLYELSLRGIHWQSQLWTTIVYKGIEMKCELKLDVLVESVLAVELKTVEAFHPRHEAIILSYMRSLQSPKGVLINFHCTNIWKEGQKTFVNDLFRRLPRE